MALAWTEAITSATLAAAARAFGAGRSFALRGMIWSWPRGAYSGAGAGATSDRLGCSAGSRSLIPLRSPPSGRGTANSMSRKPERGGRTKRCRRSPPARSALPGRGGLARIAAAFRNSLRGLQEGLSTESAIKQEVAIACVLVPLSFFVAKDLWTWVALIASLLFVLSVEFLNTAIERLCNHIQPGKHEAIRVQAEDLASAWRLLLARCLAASRLARRALGALMSLRTVSARARRWRRGATPRCRPLRAGRGEDLRMGRRVLGDRSRPR